MAVENGPKDHDETSEDIEAFLEQKAHMEQMFKDKFTKRLSVMFTDLKGSTAIAESEGDLSTRLLLKDHNAIVFPAISENNGMLVKTIGDGTLSYFDKPQDAVRAGLRIQKGMDGLNMAKKFRVPVLIRIGIHTGDVIFESKDIFGDVVNTASRFESSANAGDVQISQETFDGLTDKSEFLIRYIKEIQLKGKSRPVPVYKVYWNSIEFEEHGKSERKEVVHKKPMHPALKLVLIVMVPLLLMFAFIQINDSFSRTTQGEDRRSIRHTVDMTDETGKP